MTNLSGEKAGALAWLDASKARLSEFHLGIWDHAETSWREYRSAADYVSLLEAEGFSVERGSGDMPTAFAATWGSSGPVIGAYAEYDAVPGNSQQAIPRRAPREGTHPWAPGHTDPHSALGVGALAGVLAAKEAMSRAGLAGTIRFFGEPAEKVCGSKPIHAAKGYYDDLDAVISYHPWFSNTTVWDTHCGSYWSCVFTFECTETEQWADPALLAFPGRPHAVPRSPGALDAVSLMYTVTKHTKENMYPHDGSWIMNEFLMVGGQATADNLVPRIAQIQYCGGLRRWASRNSCTGCSLTTPAMPPGSPTAGSVSGGSARPGSVSPTTPSPLRRTPTSGSSGRRCSRTRPGTSRGRSSGPRASRRWRTPSRHAARN